jgi:hypothetical protein
MKSSSSSSSAKESHHLSFICHIFRMDDKCCQFFDVILSIIVRLVYLGEAGFCIYYLANIMGSNYYYILIIFLAVILVDGVYVVIKRFGKEYTWYNASIHFSRLISYLLFHAFFRVSLSCVSYSVIMITLIWHLVLIKYDMKNHDCSPDNATMPEPSFWILVSKKN